MTINTETIRDAAEVLDTLTSALAADHPLRTRAAARAKSCVSGLYSAADALDAQAAEIERFRSMEDMLRSLPISTDRDRRMYGKGYFAGSRKRVLDLQRALCKAVDVILEKNAEIERLREAIQDAIRLLGMDRPINPTATLARALSGESKC